MKKRLDVLLVEKGFFESREKAKAVIMSGCVYVIRRNLRADADKWDSFKCVIDEFIRNGCRQVKA